MIERTSVAALPELSVADIRGAGAPALLDEAGAVVIRHAGIARPAEWAGLAGELGLAAMDQVEPFAPRRYLGHGAWSQPDWPATSPMCMHQELGWQRQPPPYLLIACLRPPASGGRTGVADGRAVLSLLPDPLVERAASRGWTLVRRYSPGLIGMPWQDAFPGMDARAVEAYAAVEAIELEWAPQRLLTRRDRPAIRATGGEGTPAWSNLLAFCSEWALDPAVRAYLVSTVGTDGLPFQTSFGDGSSFTATDVETVNAAYERITVHVTWTAGDVLLLDNVRSAHSMAPFTGERRMAVLHATPV